MTRIPLIEARQLKKSYSTGELTFPVLRGVDLAVEAGTFTVLVGPSGSGKTTLLNLVGALDTADAGELVVNGHPLIPHDPKVILKYRRTTVSFIFQFYNLLPTLTAQENVELVLEPLGVRRREASLRAQSILARVGLSGKGTKFPSQLSGGEQQRVAVARALVRKPPLVVADEPTGSLDRATGGQVVRLMKELCRQEGTTFFVVTHDPEVAAQASHVVRMLDGRIVADGAAPASLATQPPRAPGLVVSVPGGIASRVPAAPRRK